MWSFTEIAIPHKDILDGKFTLETYASDLWEVYKGSAPLEYRDRELFFERTYETDGLKQIVKLAETRLNSGSADSVVQLQTPFGGGKTHTLIYLYHKAKEWNANVFVFSGDKVDAKENTIWEEMERQLSGKVEIFSGKAAPGGEKIKEFLSKYEPLLILMDEVHAFLVNALAVRVENSDLATQSLVFIQYLTNAIRSMEKAALFVSLPASNPYGSENSEKILKDLQRIIGRTERVLAPVNDEEIADVVKRRLFTKIDETKAKKIVKEFVDYAESEEILPTGIDKAQYRERFLKSYPFQPEVIDVLYTRWGSIPTFQRTRGVLRLLALVVHSLINSKKSFIRLSDFDLSNDDIRDELTKHLGKDYDSIIAQDITLNNSGAKKVDKALGDSYRSYQFGTAVATTIFMYSFSGGGQKGATKSEIKLSCAEPNVNSSIIIETIDRLKESLYYLADEGLFFKKTPNLNKTLLDKIDNIKEEKIESFEEELLNREISDIFEKYIWPFSSKDVADTPSIKLIILKKDNGKEEIYENYGERPRIYKNALIFLASDPSERCKFELDVKKYLAWQEIDKDKKLALSEEQKKEIKAKLQDSERQIKTSLRSLYRKVYLPSKNGLKEKDLGLNPFGKDRSIDKEIYIRLKNDSELVESLAPKVVTDKYLHDKNFLETKKLLDAFLKVPGEIRISSPEVLKKTIQTGVKDGIWGLGTIEGEKINCLHYKEECDVSFSDNEVIIRSELCQRKILDDSAHSEVRAGTKNYYLNEPISYQYMHQSSNEQSDAVSSVYNENSGIVQTSSDEIKSLKLQLQVPNGKFSKFLQTLKYLDQVFKNVKIKISVEADAGTISKFDYENKIKEAFQQSEIVIEKEEFE